MRIAAAGFYGGDPDAVLARCTWPRWRKIIALWNREPPAHVLLAARWGYKPPGDA